MVKTVMVRAWEIARAAVVKFGGKVREYLAEALRQAWAESLKVLKGVRAEVIFNRDTNLYTITLFLKGGRYGEKLDENVSKQRYMEAWTYCWNYGVRTAVIYQVSGGVKSYTGYKTYPAN